MRGDDHDLDRRALLLDPAQQIQTVAVAQHQVEQQDVGAILLEGGPGLGERGGGGDLKPLVDQHRL